MYKVYVFFDRESPNRSSIGMPIDFAIFCRAEEDLIFASSRRLLDGECDIPEFFTELSEKDCWQLVEIFDSIEDAVRFCRKNSPVDPEDPKPKVSYMRK